MANLHTKIIESMKEVPSAEWNRLASDVTFSYEWMKTIEEGKLGKLLPQHILIYDADRLIGICPGFIQREDIYYSVDAHAPIHIFV